MKKLILFDLDGVIFNTKINMERSWNDVKEEFGININFKYYFNKIGIPFNQILKKLCIERNKKKIELFYKKKSIFYNNFTKIYPNVKTTLNYLKKNYKLGIVTSKDRFRTKKLIDQYKLKFSVVICPSKKIRGKPFPDPINKALNLVKVKRQNAVYVGDTGYDFLAAKRSFVKFIYASYGYGKLKKKGLFCIKKFSDLKKYF
jgi:HAD superfamily hydrolase (TIGR01549 family)